MGDKDGVETGSLGVNGGGVRGGKISQKSLSLITTRVNLSWKKRVSSTCDQLLSGWLWQSRPHVTKRKEVEETVQSNIKYHLIREIFFFSLFLPLLRVCVIEESRVHSAPWTEPTGLSEVVVLQVAGLAPQ